MRSKMLRILVVTLFGVLATLGIEASNTGSPNRQWTEQPKEVSRGSGDAVAIIVDASVPGKPPRHVWQYYGYDECNYTTTAHA